MEARRTNNTKVDKTPYDIVVFKNGAPLMDAELNEMQDIMQHKLLLVHKIIGNCIVGFSPVQSSNGLYTIPAGTMAVCGGHIINMSGITINVSGNVDAIYINIEDNATYTPDDNIPEYGAVGGAGSIIQNATNTDNNILDDRLNKESTVRGGFKWRLSDTAGDGSVAVFKVVDGTLSAHDTINSINGIVSDIISNNTAIDNLRTEMNNKIGDLGKSVSDGKSIVASAITAKGQDTATDATFAVMAENIGKIMSATGDAGAGDVLAGKTFSNSNELGVVGTMTERGAWNHTLNPGGSVIIPAGHHNGSGKVTANNASGNAIAANVLTGKTFSNSSGLGISGTMPNKGAWSATIGPGYNTIIPAGYHNGSGKVTALSATLKVLYIPGRICDVIMDNMTGITVGTGYSVSANYGAEALLSFNENIQSGKLHILIAGNGTGDVRFTGYDDNGNVTANISNNKTTAAPILIEPNVNIQSGIRYNEYGNELARYSIYIPKDCQLAMMYII